MVLVASLKPLLVGLPNNVRSSAFSLKSISNARSCGEKHSVRNQNTNENRNYISFSNLYIIVSNLRFRELNSWP